MTRFLLLASCILTLWLPASTRAQEFRANYTRASHRIKMRDGAQLFTIVYAPKDKSQTYPILMTRTPYGIPPYEEGIYRFSLGPNKYFAKEGYIFVYQDVRGRYMSEGVYANMRPQLPALRPRGEEGARLKEIDESTDTYDTIDWLVKNVPNNNGKVGLFGISYPGFYTSAGMINAHPALKAASPQAPIADWFFDDFYHHGAFFLAHAFPFFGRFGDPRGPELTTQRVTAPNYGTNDGYKFFLDIGPLKNVNPRYYKNKITFWNEMMEHPTYDKFWQDRNLLPHLKKVAPAVMTVGGWFDAEDLYGTFMTYQAVEKQNPGVFNVLVCGPWSHGQWSSGSATSLGHIGFGADTAAFYQKEIELPFFNHFLKGKGEHGLPEAYVFETGRNQWRKFDHWPPKGVEKLAWQFVPKGGLLPLEALSDPDKDGFDSYVSDPKKPVPTCERIAFGMPPAYMTDDMRYASVRPDVLTYQTGPLDRDLTFAGPIEAELYVSTTGTDSDWVVKVIDVFPNDYKGASAQKNTDKDMRGYQMHVRSEILRGRYRNSFEKPEPFKPGEVTKIKLTLQDVLHTFKKGHRVMVQVHSSWFPLADRNPQKYVPNIFFANEDDFITATHRVYRSPDYRSQIRVGVMLEGEK
jgi:putative CocE/NonD family hydrolase